MYHKNPEVNAKIESICALFTSDEALHHEVVQEFVTNILACIPKAAGKPTSDKAFAIREAIQEQKEAIAEKYPNGWSVKELAELLGYDAPNTSNQVRWVIENVPGLLEVVGKRPAPRKGKPSTLYNYISG